MEAGDGPIRATYENVTAVVAALESAGVEFTNGDKPGVQLARQPASASKPASAKQAKPAAAKLRSGGRPAKSGGKRES
jgi:hypothetical protein